MKKYKIPTIILLIMITIIVLLIVVIKIKDNYLIEDESINITYTKTINNYINNIKYSTTKESYILNNNMIYHTKEITYENNDNIIKTSIEEEYTKENNVIKFQDKTIYLENNKLCFDSQCNNIFKTEEIDNYINNFNYEDNLINIKNIEDYINNKDLTIIIISSNTCLSCIEYKNILAESLNDYNINYYILDINKLTINNKKELLSKYDITSTPTTLVYKDGKLLTKEVGVKNLNYLENILFRNNAKSR